MEEVKELLVMPEKFDYTMLSTFLTCRRKYYLRIVRGIVGKIPPTAAEFGRCIHKALDIWHMEHNEDKAVESFASTFKEQEGDEKRTIPVGKKLLELYFEKYAREGFDVVSSETEFEVPLQDSRYMLVGRIDKIVKWDNAYWVLDHKTTSRLGYEFFYRIKPNMQFDGYVYAASNVLGCKVVGVILDALLVAKGLVIPSQLSKLTPLARDYSTRTDEDIRRYISNVKLILRDIEECYKTGMWYENTESCCNFVECPYRKICKEDESLHERVIEMDYTIEHWNHKKEN